MRVQEILEHYSDNSLDKISADKLDEAVNLRLPRSVIIQEIAEALSSLAYVSKILAPTRPPTYAFLKLLLDAPGYRLPIEDFQEKVNIETTEMTLKAGSGKGLSAEKNYRLYLKVLKTAWEDEKLDRNEVLLLGVLREELGIWTSEHLLLEHHPDVQKIDDFSSAFISVRNLLLRTGLVLTLDQHYILAEEVALQIRRTFGIDLKNDAYERLLNIMTKMQLHNTLEKTGLQVSGAKEEQIKRVVNSLMPPGEILEWLNIEELKDLCRQTKAPISGAKADVIANLIEHFDQERDLVNPDAKSESKKLPAEPEKRELDDPGFTRLLQQLSKDNLYDVLSANYLKTSGNKETKIKRILESPWSERSMLKKLRQVELANICRKVGIPITGVKSELIDRLIQWSSTAESLDKISKQADTPEIIDLKDTETQEISIPGINDIKNLYAFLEPDEQAILALIKETKSLTDQEIGRASRNHGFEWFLTKAHMAEMFAKLKRTGNLPIRIKSVGSENIYEWRGDSPHRHEQIEQTSARDVINALRQGVVPGNHLDLLAVGQENAREHLIKLLKEIHDSKSAFKFIRGQYGAGKTFLCSWLQQYALDNEYVVSLVNIGPDQPLSDLPIFFSGIIKGLRTPEKRDASALSDVIESWLLSIHRKTAQIEGLKAFDQSSRESLLPLVEDRIESELSAISDIDPCFPPALRAFYHSRVTGDKITASNAVAWLSGSRSVPVKKLNEMGMRGYLESHQVFPRLRALLEIIGRSRFKGILVMVDEVEAIRRFPHARQREQALETLRLLIDETGKNGFPRCLLIFTGTDTFFEDDRAGLKSYEALANRVAAPGGPARMVSIKQPVICLEGLNQEKLLSVVSKVRDIHGTAYGWNSRDYVTDDFLQKIVQDWTHFGSDSIPRSPRLVLKDLINILDICEENPGVDLNEFSSIPADNRILAKEIGDIFLE